MRIRTYTCPNTGKIYNLPAGLYPHQNGIPNRWRIGKEQRALVDSTGNNILTPEEAIAVADAINALSTSSVKDGRHKTDDLSKLCESFIEERNKQATEAQRNKQRHIDSTYSLRKFVREVSHINVHRLNERVLSEWWNGTGEFSDAKYQKSGHTQRSMRPILARFVGLLISRSEIAARHNVFNSHSDSYAGMNPKEITRKRLTPEQFNQIKNMALQDGKMWFVNAMDIAFLTGMRRGDIVSLTFDDNLAGNQLRVKFKKSHNQNRKGESRFWDLASPKNESLSKTIERCIATRSLCIKVSKSNSNDIPAMHLIHDHTAKMRECKDKVHFSQITPTHLSHTFSDYAKLVPALAEMSEGERPSFHEIRALHISIGVNDKGDLEGTQSNVGHKSAAVTEMYASGHKDIYKEAVAHKAEDLSEASKIKPALSVAESGNIISLASRRASK